MPLDASIGSRANVLGVAWIEGAKDRRLLEIIGGTRRTIVAIERSKAVLLVLLVLLAAGVASVVTLAAIGWIVVTHRLAEIEAPPIPYTSPVRVVASLVVVLLVVPMVVGWCARPEGR